MNKFFHLTIVIFFLVPLTSFSYDLYFVNGDSVGVNPLYNGNYNNPYHWDTVSGGPGLVIIPGFPDDTLVPKSTDNVIFDGGSGLGVGKTVYITSSSVCHDFMWNGGTSGTKVSGNGSLDVYGSFMLAPMLDIRTWFGDLNFYSSGTESIIVRGNTFYNWNIEFKPFGGNFIVNDKWTQRYYIGGGWNPVAKTIFNTNGGSVTFNDDYEAGARVDIQNSTNVLVLGDFTTGSPNITSWVGYYQQSINQYPGTNMVVEGNTNVHQYRLDGGVLKLKGDTSSFGIMYYYGGDATDTLDMRNNVMNIKRYFRCLDGPHSILTDNSTINGIAGTTTFIGGNSRTYNVVNFYEYANLLTSPIFDSLTFYAGCLTQNDINIGVPASNSLFKLNISPTVYEFSNRNINIASNVYTDIVGTCDSNIFLRSAKFNFSTPAGTGAQHLMDYVRMEGNTAAGPDVSYNAGAGSYEVAGTSNIGWLVNNPIPRYLRWIGPIPTNIATDSLYGIWDNPNNWSNNPIASPNNPIGGPQCPPKFVDSVVFPDSSYVNVVAPISECKHMVWEQEGNIIGQQVKELEVWGSLYFSPEMTNSFMGTVLFRAWEQGQTITVNDKQFNYKVDFKASSDTGQWFLLDSFSAPVTIPNGPTIDLWRGDLHTNGNPILTHKFRSEGSGKRILNLYNSVVEVTGSYNQYGVDDGGGNEWWPWKVTTRVSGLAINAGTSHIYFTYPSPSSSAYHRMYAGDNHKYYNITFKNAEKPRIYCTNDTFNIVTFEKSGFLVHLGTQSYMKKLQTHIVDNSIVFDFGDGNIGRDIQIDTAFYYGGVNFNSLGNYNHKMKLFSGGTYTFGANGTQTLNAANVLDAQASCTDNIFINNGILASTFYQWGDYLLINGNSAVGTIFDAFNSQSIGTVSGWNVPPSVGRKLYWIDTTTNASMKQWNDRSSWSLADGYMLDQMAGNDFNVGNCPPTPLDTVIFTNNSFTGNDTVNIDLGATKAACYSMDWSQTNLVSPVFYTTNPTNSPGDPTVGQWLEVYGSLAFSSIMNHQFNGSVKFRGVGTDNTITSAGQSFKRWLYFEGDSDSTEWHLQDSLAVPWNPSVRTTYLSRGHLHTDGYPLLTGQFFSRTNSIRSLNLYNSNMYITGRYYRPLWVVYHHSWETHNTSNLTINAGTSNIHFISSGAQHMILGNNHKLNNVDLLAPSSSIQFNQRDTFNVVTYYNTGNFGYYFADSNNVAQKIEFVNDAGVISSHNLTADSIVFSRNGTINYSSYINNLLRFTPGMTYTLGANYVQHIANAGEFDLLGSPGNQITLRSTVSGVETFIRKDSGRICADYIFMRDQWAIGNGFSPQQDTSVVPAVYNNPYLDTSLVSSGNPLDTSFVTRHNPLGYEINYENNYQLRDSSGRAMFQGGAYADDQGNNAGWSFAPYPPYPDASIVNINDTICENDSTQLVFELIGDAPFNVQYSVNTVDTSIFIDSVNVNITSGQGTLIDPFIWSFYVNPTQTTKYIIEEIQSERCFNDVTLGSLDSVEIQIDSLPYNIVVFASPDTVCPMSTTVITATANNGFIFEVYDSLIGGTLLDSTSYITIPLASTDTFYIEAISPYRGCRSTSRESMIIPVMDITPPVVICNDTTVYLDASGQVIIDTSFIFTSATDNCAMDSVWSNDTLFTCVNVGLNTAKIYALDVNGNIDSCTANVTVMDTINPVVACNDTTIYLDALGQYSIDASYVFSNASDNCGVDSVWINTSDALFTCADTGVNTVTVYVRDANNNIDSCIANVTVLDTINPVVVCNDTTIYLDALGQYSIDTSYVYSNASDNCGVDSIWISTADILYTCADIGVNSIAVYVRDNNGNVDSCAANVRVMDTINPAVVCNDTTIYLNALGQYSIDTSYVFSNASDNCGVDSIWISTTDTLYTCSTIGVNTVTVYARDNNGNIDSCIANVTVMDTINPVVVCNDTTIYLDALGQYSIDTSYVFSNASDNCGVDSVWINTSDALFTCADTGVNTVTVYVRDANNIDSCIANVTVLDTINPVVVCNDTTIYLDALGQYSIDTSYVFSNASDNCGVDSIWISTADTLYTCSNIGVNTVTVYVRDNNGNMDSCTANVTVMDTISPTIVCQSATIYLGANGQASIDTTGLVNSVSDNCSVDSVWVNVNDTLITCLNLGNYTATIYVMDNSGNLDSCLSNLTVLDTINPVVVCNDTTIYLNASGSYTIDTSYVYSNSSDNCSVDSVWITNSGFNCSDTGLNTVTVYISDNSGNIDSCTANVMVLDTVNPTINCKNAIVYLDTNGQFIIDTSYVYSSAFAGCGLDSIWIADSIFDCSRIGVNTISVYAKDINGNIDSCQAQVTVMDSINPQITCGSTLYDTVTNACEYIVPDFRLSTQPTDNCTDSMSFQITQIPAPGTVITIQDQQTESIVITVTDTNGNQTVCMFDVEITCNDEFQIPEFISPNGDGKNDTWIITGIEAYPNNNVKVFNRYGAMVYQTNGYHNQWDGTANVDYIFQSGESDGILPSGTYYFILELDVNAKEKEVFKGIIQIQK